MSSIEVRPFRRADREQLTALVNAHAAAVVPGATVSVNTVLSHLEREPREFIVDPWVLERRTLVAEQRGRIVAAAHLLRYANDESVGESYRDAGEIRWLLFWPDAPFWPDSRDGADVLVGACVVQLDRWAVVRQYADGTLPVPGVYGVPGQWPHVRETYARAGFVHNGQTEVVYIASIDELPRGGAPPFEGLSVRRSLGINGTRLSAIVDGDVAGYIEVETLEEPGRVARGGGLADIGNLHVAEPYRRRRVATWLVAEAADWLRLGRVERVLEYAWTTDTDAAAFLATVGFRELTRTERGWERTRSAAT
jgi:ribosomal protein S18 acetylase RimI-like enzyme